MKKYIIEPEVAGQLGDDTVLNYSTKPPIIEKLNYEFDDWLGDDFIEGFQCFICSERLAEYIKKQNLTGYTFDDCKITKSQFFNDLHEDGLILPLFYWFKIIGNENDDFFIVPNSMLVVSQHALETLQAFNMDRCQIQEYEK
ncbi:hypothetical protein [Mucilaginibacter sp.]|uniref:hypothetical protein n=1 Tax=Mucilaginibacter sp. TaxID=1882438 RepID=UPI00260BB159|nr:hypothetical protein [Mucilaginibacter sp.]MDB4923520.1 hypothetical protein [Mucilaginibacter sp.]